MSLHLAPSLYATLFPRFRRSPAHAPSRAAAASHDGVRIRWLGTAGFVIESRATTLLIDPYLTRAPLTRLFGSRLLPSEVLIRSELPPRVDAVLCGHSHFDHLLDAPFIAASTGAKIVGSVTTCAFAAAHQLPRDQQVVVPPGGLELVVGDFEVRFVPSLHARLLLGSVPFPGEVEQRPNLPTFAWNYRMGGAFGIFVRHRDLTLYHNGSADLIDARLAGRHADVLLVGIAGRHSTSRYLERLLGLLTPRLVVPTHHDAFFAPLDRGVHLLPGIDLPRFAEQTASIAPRARVVLPVYDEVLMVGPHAIDVVSTH